MSVIEKFDSRIRVFKWNNVGLPPESFGGVFLIRFRTWLKSCTSRSEENQNAEVIQLSPAFLSNLLYPGTRRLLLFYVLKRVISSLCLFNINSLERLAEKLVTQLHSKFRFSPELLSGFGPKLVIFIDLEILARMMQQSEAASSSDDSDIDSDSDVHGNHKLEESMNLGAAPDFGVEAIEEILNRCYGSINSNIAMDDENHVQRLDEVKAGFQFKLFDEDYNNNGITSDDVEGKVCSICLERLQKNSVVAETPCCHIFHMECISNWLLEMNSCPMCRSACAVSV
ncbi:hypothetical protein ACH5RR_003618 [Cinchona calisaya]|uniref:RING-type domain-containing protein n=1 Tax=Cinchona calisaya TaxID=153742 RepID=A0ABD3AVB0_9GENT